MIDKSTPKLCHFKPSIVLVGGASGIGKTTIVDSLIKLKNELYARPRSFTSREKRPGESEQEYSFVTREDIYELQKRHEILTIDEVYGNLYAISSKSVTEILRQNRIPIKEVHPKNHSKIRKIFPDLISVIIFNNSSPLLNTQRDFPKEERRKEDQKYYSEINLIEFDIILRIESDQSVEIIAKNLHFSIYALACTHHFFPSPRIIDQTNMSGYTKAAPEFTDDQRVTTKNFHKLSYSYFEDSISRYIQPRMKCIETGPGHGWLENILPMSQIDYTGIEISSEMIKHNKTNSNILQSTTRFINFPDKYFDVAISSLSDPYCHPVSLCEIRRVLKPESLFIFSSPSRSWSDAIRDHKDRFKTTFIVEDGSYAEVFSFTFTVEELKQLLFLCGFKIKDYHIVYGENLFSSEISPAITKAAENLKTDLSELPILNFIIAERK